MTLTQSSLTELAMQKAVIYAHKLWGNDPEKINDAVSIAWELSQSGKGTPVSIALFAVRRVRVNRQFSQSERGMYAESKRTGPKPRIGFLRECEIDESNDPARIGGTRIDANEWWRTLSPRTREIATLLAIGESTLVVAKLFGLSPARISQLRSELEASWAEYLAED